MAACFWAVVTAIFFAPPGGATGIIPLDTVKQKVQTCRTVAGRLAGRVLGCLVCKGMTGEQVQRILGKPWSPFKPLGAAGSTRCCQFSFSHYHHFGLLVGFQAGPGEGLRVSSVTYAPLFD
jgi:hypothetical protein